MDVVHIINGLNDFIHSIGIEGHCVIQQSKTTVKQTVAINEYVWTVWYILDGKKISIMGVLMREGSKIPEEAIENLMTEHLIEEICKFAQNPRKILNRLEYDTSK